MLKFGFFEIVYKVVTEFILNSLNTSCRWVDDVIPIGKIF